MIYGSCHITIDSVCKSLDFSLSTPFQSLWASNWKTKERPTGTTRYEHLHTSKMSSVRWFWTTSCKIWITTELFERAWKLFTPGTAVLVPNWPHGHEPTLTHAIWHTKQLTHIQDGFLAVVLSYLSRSLGHHRVVWTSLKAAFAPFKQRCGDPNFSRGSSKQPQWTRLGCEYVVWCLR